MAGLRLMAMFLALALASLLALPCRANDGFIAEGEVVVGYTLDHFEHHPEYLRLHFSAGEQRTVLEIGLFDGATGAWTTGRHRLMPAPEQQPPGELMRAVMERLLRYDEGNRPPLVAQERRGARAPGVRRVERVPRSWLLGCLLAGLAWSVLLLLPRAQTAVRKIERHVEARPWPYLALLLLAMAIPRLLHLDTPFSADAMTQRLFFGSLDVGDILAHRYDDQRHPQLFYLILHGFLRLGHSETIARLPAVLFSLASAVMLFVLARPRLGAARALLVTALLGLSLAFLISSREVGDLTLFTFLVLTSSHLLLRAIEQPRRTTWIALALCEAAMFYAYYLAVLVAAAHLLVALIHARKRGRRGVFLALAAAWLAAIPNLRKLLVLVRDDTAARDVARVFPVHMWGEQSTAQLLGRVGELFAPNTPMLVLLAALALIGVARFGPRPWREPLVNACLSLLVLAFTVLGAAVVLVRLKPSYLLFALPFVLVLAVAGALGVTSRRRLHASWSALGAGAGVTAMTLLVVMQATAMRRGIEQTLTPRYQPRFVDLGSVIREHARRDPPGPGTVIADGNNLHTILLYYAFDDPLGMYRTCSIDQDGDYGTRCRRGDQQLVTLTRLPDLSEGWEGRSVARLREVQRGRDSWAIYADRFPNEPLFRYLSRRCELVGHFDEGDALNLYRCPAL